MYNYMTSEPPLVRGKCILANKNDRFVCEIQQQTTRFKLKTKLTKMTRLSNSDQYVLCRTLNNEMKPTLCWTKIDNAECRRPHPRGPHLLERVETSNCADITGHCRMLVGARLRCTHTTCVVCVRVRPCV